MLKEYLKAKGISINQLSKRTNIAYSTLNYIVSGKTPIEKCESYTLYKISKELSLTMEQVYEMCRKYTRQEFELFKSEVCHEVKGKGNRQFLIDKLQSTEIEYYWEIGRKEQCLYLLSMIDYLSRLENIPRYTKYEFYRKQKMNPVIYPLSGEIYSKVMEEPLIFDDAIPEFLEHGIIEGDVLN